MLNKTAVATLGLFVLVTLSLIEVPRSAAGSAQTPAIQPPVKVKDVAPVYPTDALSARQEGVVIVEASISETGKVTDVRFLREHSHRSLNAAARDAVLQWEYQPARSNGVAIRTVFTIAVTFKIPDNGASAQTPTAQVQASPTEQSEVERSVAMRPAASGGSMAESTFNGALELGAQGQTSDALRVLYRLPSDFPRAPTELLSYTWFHVGRLELQGQQGARARDAFQRALTLGGLRKDAAAAASRMIETAQRLERPQMASGSPRTGIESFQPQVASAAPSPNRVTDSCKVSYSTSLRQVGGPSSDTFLGSNLRMSGCDGKHYWRNVRWMMTGTECQDGNITNCRERLATFNCSARIRTIYMSGNGDNWGLRYNERRLAPNDPDAGDCTPATSGARSGYVRRWNAPIILSHTCTCREPDE